MTACLTGRDGGVIAARAPLRPLPDRSDPRSPPESRRFISFWDTSSAPPPTAPLQSDAAWTPTVFGFAPDPPRRPALFVDRDGTLIEDPGYIADPDKVRLIAGAAAALRRFRDAGYALILVTNQSGIGRGLYRWSDYEAVAARFRALLASEGVVFDAELACGHSPEEGTPAAGGSRPRHDPRGRRPSGLDLARSVIAGDKLSDLEAGAAAGIPRPSMSNAGRARRAGRMLNWHGPVPATCC